MNNNNESSNNGVTKAEFNRVLKIIQELIEIFREQNKISHEYRKSLLEIVEEHTSMIKNNHERIELLSREVMKKKSWIGGTRKTKNTHSNRKDSRKARR
jgi:hemoglobin-like flavoprotein